MENILDGFQMNFGCVFDHFYLVLILDVFGRWSSLLPQLLGVMEANVGHGWIGIKFGMNWDGFGWILEMGLDGS